MRAVRGRPKTFDRDQALEAAHELCWRQGYTVTAIGDLTEQMGIGRQSLYDTFGDKHS
ncbi:MAG: TetR/AcrR family transcriptional regulator, partial [bacterium]|nr:TetR/AcrR family transcriptional regulator [bacterium]